jgi:hypothetical protein
MMMAERVPMASAQGRKALDLTRGGLCQRVGGQEGNQGSYITQEPGETMEYTVLGRTGLRVSRVGCGGGGLGHVWGSRIVK